MFKRRLGEAERETVKSYTRRVRVLSISYVCCLNLESLEDLCLPSITDPLFPNLQRFSYSVGEQNLPFIRHPVSPTLKFFYLTFELPNISPCENFVHSFEPTCPNVKNIFSHALLH